MGELVIEGLKFAQGDHISFTGPVLVEYFLDFGFCIAGKKYSKEFTLISYCDNIIRYKFDNYERITFIPSSGHIFPGSKKTILSILEVSDCLDIDENIECIYQEIIYKKNVYAEEWDNNKKSVKWSKVIGDSLTKENFPKAQILKIEKCEDEPEYDILREEVKLPLTVSAVTDIPKLTVVTELVEFPSITVSQSVTAEVVIQNVKNCEVSWRAEITDERSEVPKKVPLVSDFSFGKFDCNLVELPIKDEKKSISFDESLVFFSGKLSSKTKSWNDMRTKHMKTLYGKSVTIIFPTVEEDKEQEKDSDVKSPKKNYRPKSTKTKSLLDIKKRLLLKKMASTISPPGRRESKTFEGKKGSLTLPVMKHIAKLGIKRNDVYEYNFSDLVRIGKNHIFLPADLPETVVQQQAQSNTNSQCFCINVSSGTLKPKGSFTCLVTFTPKHINYYKADLRFYNVATGEYFSIFLQGAGILPLCHIEIYEDTYLTKNNPLISHLPASTKSVTVESMFIESFLKKSFKVYNIAEIPYHFQWILIRNSDSLEKGIKCSTVEGEIPPRDSFEMEFSFLPMDYNIYESLWLLKIQEFFLEQYILFVFKIRKPLVSFERRFLVCEPIVKGFKKILNVKLINDEDILFNYAVNEDSLYGGLSNDKYLSITPMFGIIGPKAEELLEIEFTSLSASDLTFYIRVNIHSHEHQTKYEIPPLRILSKGYCVVPKISCLKEGGSKQELFHSDTKSHNVIKIGKLLLRFPYSLQFNISNAGDYPMYFEVFLSDSNHQPGVSIDILEKSGVVQPLKSYSLCVKLIAIKKVDFEEIIIIKVCKGPDFYVKLVGTAAEPAYEFSHQSFNFGICLIDEKKLDKYYRVLEFSNLDTESVLLEKINKEKLEGFFVDFSSLIIEPRAVHKIPIIFRPIKLKKYSGKLHFLVNDIYKHEIDLKGEGEKLKLALHGRENIIVDFGLLKAREISGKEIAIVNKSKAPVDFSLNTSQQKKNELFPLTIDFFEKKMHLLPDEVRLVKISIYAEKRIQNFTCNINYEGYGVEEVIFIVKGTVIDYKFELDQKSILFGSASLGCVTTKQVALINSGDIGSRFRLQTRFVSDVFAIKPLEGYSPPSSSTVIEISFMANYVSKYCNNTIIFLIENYEPITLAVTGIGVKFPPPSEIIKFHTTVRTKAYHFVDLINRSYEEMTVHPIITGEYFSTEELIKIPADSRNVCKVFYNPQTMTTNQYHLGHFFCAYPNGEILFYQLVGEAKALPEQVIDWECICKKTFIGKIPLKNWLSSSENFKVSIKSLRLTEPAFHKITTHDVISIPPQKTRNCLISVLCYKPIAISFKLIITNFNSKEFLHYRIHVKCNPSEVETIRIETPIHEPAICKIPLANPMDKITLFRFQSPHREIKPSKKAIQVRPFSKKNFTLKYIPTHLGRSKIFIKICNYLLGDTVYKLEVSAIKPSAEKFIEIQTSIGTKKSFSVPIKNPYQEVVGFLFKSYSIDLSMENPSFLVGPGKMIMVNVMYEPTCLGNNLMYIVFHTNGYGDFSYQVKGLCTPAQPSGPLFIFKGFQFEFEFKNVFFNSYDFFFKINNGNLKVLPEKLHLNAKETGLVYITFEDSTAKDEHSKLQGISETGKLTVSCMAESVPIDWVYYLQVVD